MLTSKRFILPALLLLVAIGFGVYQAKRASELDAMLTTVIAERETTLDSLGRFERLLAADSLLYVGEYRTAIGAYEELAADTGNHLLASRLPERIDHARRLIQLGRAMDTLQLVASRSQQSSIRPLEAVSTQPVERIALERSNPNQYDSLAFALRKADMRIRNLEGRLENTTGSHYLTFSSQAGNTVWYVGDINNGEANGHGVALFSSGSRYVGAWQDNRRHGVGEFHWTDGAYYEGEYVDDRRSGEGTYHFADGQTFVGTWENDLRNGAGVFYEKSGKVVARGIWAEDELVEEM